MKQIVLFAVLSPLFFACGKSNDVAAPEESTLNSITYHSPGSGETSVINFAYDPSGRIVSIQSAEFPGNPEVTYSGNQVVAKQIGSDGFESHLTFTINAAGNPMRRIAHSIDPGDNGAGPIYNTSDT